MTDVVRERRRAVTERQGRTPCEGCCGPSDYFDEDGVPLCWTCLKALVESDSGQPDPSAIMTDDAASPGGQA